MKRYDVISVGGATEDLFFTVDDYVMINNHNDPLRTKLVGFEYGAKLGVKGMTESFGGGAANTAVTFARLGFKTAALIAVGKDERGGRIVANLKKHRVDTRFIEHSAQASGVSFVLKTTANEHVLFTHRGANDKLNLQSKALKAVRGARRVYVSSLSGSWRSVLEIIIHTQASVAWNPGRVQLAAGYASLKQFLKQSDILILNKDEATELVLSAKGEAKRSETMSYLLKRLQSFGPRLVVITDGVKGASAYDGKKVFKQTIIKSKVVDTTGVGDAFGATFTAAIDNHHDISKALKMAAKNSASVVTKPGAENGLLSAAQLGL